MSGYPANPEVKVIFKRKTGNIEKNRKFRAMNEMSVATRHFLWNN
jgi:hypothetical protein